ncbi:serine hydrolase domain-containing protein [Streptomyces sp. DG2A-72]|uniref:serine hydrolase domain-containing protein n=1 Tax=Streptomyces sp. DG2A-72 TaxID=3051386 RepID=UPI00265BFBDA|nr:serine hydrolase domain-containing protein [Streptomyces sp. DG2A-72]MDO0939123.1 serine hydrolase domain-containing protein [Streptomyces sp. DG2A-72]
MTANPHDLTARLRSFHKQHGLPGIAAAVVTADSVLMAATGTRVRGGSDPVGEADTWHIGSCGKSMTAALWARLVQRGQATWEDTVSELFCDLDPKPHPAWQTVTITDLLSHFAGLAGNLTQADLKAAYSKEESPADQRTEVAARALAAPPVRYGRFLYSNLGYTIAGAAIERVTGEPFDSAMGREILHPLGMSSAGFGPPSGDQPWGHRPRWVMLGRGEAIAPNEMSLPHPADNPPVMTPAGRLHVSLADWARFVRLFLTDGPDFLTAESVGLLTTSPPGRKSSQGLGWAIPAGGSPPIAHAQQGSNMRWIATALVHRDRHHAVLIVCNDGRQRLLRACARLGLALVAT